MVWLSCRVVDGGFQKQKEKQTLVNFFCLCDGVVPRWFQESGRKRKLKVTQKV